MAREKMYLVKREVYAESIEEAMHKDGKIYCIELAAENNQEKPNEEEISGFIKK